MSKPPRYPRTELSCQLTSPSLPKAFLPSPDFHCDVKSPIPSSGVTMATVHPIHVRRWGQESAFGYKVTVGQSSRNQAQNPLACPGLIPCQEQMTTWSSNPRPPKWPPHPSSTGPDYRWQQRLVFLVIYLFSGVFKKIYNQPIQSSV